MSPLIFGTLFVAALVGSGMAGVKDGVYTIKNTVNTTENGQTSIVTLFLEALAPKQEKGVGDVVTNVYTKNGGFHWEVKRIEQVRALQKLTPQANTVNIITEKRKSDPIRGFRFPAVRNGSNLHLIEFFSNEGLKCIKNEGLQKNVSFVQCPSRAERANTTSSPLFWELTSVPCNETTTTTTSRPANQTTTTRQPRPTRATRLPISTRGVPTRRNRNGTTTTGKPASASTRRVTVPTRRARTSTTGAPTSALPTQNIVTSTAAPSTAAPASTTTKA